MLICALAVGAAGCGGAETKTTTVVQTVTQTAPAPPETPTTPQTPEPEEDLTDTSTLPAPSAVEPVANLPAGAVAVQGRFVMRAIRVTETYHDTEEVEDRQRVWVAKMTCDPTCTVELRRELQSGGFEKAVLEQVNGDPRTWGRTTKVRTSYCNTANGHPVTKRISLRVSAVEDIDGQPTAKRLDGFFVVYQRCVNADDKSSILYRGTRG